MPTKLQLKEGIATELRCTSPQYLPQKYLPALEDPGAPPAHTPNGIQFFRFHIHFCRKAYMSEVTAPPPPTGRHPPMGNPGSTPVYWVIFETSLKYLPLAFSSMNGCKINVSLRI